MRLITVAIYPVRLLLFHYETKLNRVGFILNRMSFSEKLFFIIFQGCFTVQLSRFLLNLFDSVCCALPRQRVLSYQKYLILSTLFFKFFLHFFHLQFCPHLRKETGACKTARACIFHSQNAEIYSSTVSTSSSSSVRAISSSSSKSSSTSDSFTRIFGSCSSSGASSAISSTGSGGSRLSTKSL